MKALNGKLKIEVKEMLNHKDYKENEYTKTIRSIIENNYNFTKKQRNMLVMHMKVFYDSLLKKDIS